MWRYIMMIDLYGWPRGLLKQQPALPSSNSTLEKLSIVIPTLNQSETLEHTILSIINQDYNNYEIIIVDGGSSDNTQSIVKKYGSWITHNKIGIDRSQSDAINKGFHYATGSIFAWINSDDYYLPGAFTRTIDSFNSDPGADVIVGVGDIITKDCKFLKRVYPVSMEHINLIKWLQGEGDWIMQQSCFWRSRIWQASGGVDTNLNLLMDVDLWFAFAKLGKSKNIDFPLAVMRYYPEIKTVSLRDDAKAETAYILARNGACDEVRQIVKDLVLQNKSLSNEIIRRDQNIVVRGLKRLW
jgi:glycosyltransferase involved in cell wall biosynthesis